MKRYFSGLLAVALLMTMSLMYRTSVREYWQDMSPNGTSYEHNGDTRVLDHFRSHHLPKLTYKGMSSSGTSYEHNGDSRVFDHFLSHSLRMLNYSGLICANLKKNPREQISTRQGTVDLLGFDPKDLIRHYEHLVSRISYVRGCMVLTVQEMYRGNWTLGGTSFRGIVSSHHSVLACSVRDYFNGTYVLHCPLYAECQHVRLTVLQVDFSQYRGITRRLDHVILEKELCAQSRYVAHKPSQNVWTHDRNGTWTWHSPNTDFRLPNSVFCELVDSFSHLYMVGSSHMYYQYLYALQYCTRYKKNIKNVLQFVRVKYISELNNYVSKFKTWASYSKKQCSVTNDMSKASKLPEEMTKCSPKKAGLLLQTGSWDASYSDFGLVMKTLLPRLKGVLQNVTALQSDVFRVLVMGPPPYYSVLQYSQCRSDEMIKLISSGLEELCRNYGVNYLNVFDIVYPRFNETLLNDHYLMCPEHTQTCSGDVGKIVTQIAIKTLAT